LGSSPTAHVHQIKKDILTDFIVYPINLKTSANEAGLDCIFAFGKNYGVAAVGTGGKQMSTGHLQLVGFKSHGPCSPNKKGHPDGCPFLFGGRGGT